MRYTEKSFIEIFYFEMIFKQFTVNAVERARYLCRTFPIVSNILKTLTHKLLVEYHGY